MDPSVQMVDPDIVTSPWLLHEAETKLMSKIKGVHR